jgi:hypothetical protein
MIEAMMRFAFAALLFLQAGSISVTVSPVLPQYKFAAYRITNPSAFQTAELPLPAMALVFRNGLFQEPGQDYTVAGNAFKFIATLQSGDLVTVVSTQ